MKKTLIAAVLSFTLLSCQSNEQKAKDLIEKHLSETLHDYDSYQSVKWGELIPIKSISEDGQSDIDSWRITHTFRAKNLNGAYRLTTIRYTLSPSLSSVFDEEEE